MTLSLNQSIIVFCSRAGLSLQIQHSPFYPLLSLPFRYNNVCIVLTDCWPLWTDLHTATTSTWTTAISDWLCITKCSILEPTDSTALRYGEAAYQSQQPNSEYCFKQYALQINKIPPCVHLFVWHCLLIRISYSWFSLTENLEVIRPTGGSPGDVGEAKKGLDN